MKGRSGRWREQVHWGYDLDISLTVEQLGGQVNELTQELVRRRLVSLERVHSGCEGLFWSTELDHARLEVAKRAFDKCPLLLEMGQEIKPERVLLCQHTVLHEP